MIRAATTCMICSNNLLTIVSVLGQIDEVAEWLRRWTANPLCSARVGSNPTFVDFFFNFFFALLQGSLYVMVSPLVTQSIVRNWDIAVYLLPQLVQVSQYKSYYYCNTYYKNIYTIG